MPTQPESDFSFVISTGSDVERFRREILALKRPDFAQAVSVILREWKDHGKNLTKYVDVTSEMIRRIESIKRPFSKSQYSIVVRAIERMRQNYMSGELFESDNQPDAAHKSISLTSMHDVLYSVLPLNEYSSKKVYEEFGGYYFAYWHIPDTKDVCVSLLNIGEYNETVKITTFVYDLLSSTNKPIRREGYIVPYRNNLYFVGRRSKTPSLSLMILKRAEPVDNHFLHGVLLTTTMAGEPFAARIYCEYLGRNEITLAVRDRVGNFPRSSMQNKITAFEQFIDNTTSKYSVLQGSPKKKHR